MLFVHQEVSSLSFELTFELPRGYLISSSAYHGSSMLPWSQSMLPLMLSCKWKLAKQQRAESGKLVLAYHTIHINGQVATSSSLRGVFLDNRYGIVASITHKSILGFILGDPMI